MRVDRHTTGEVTVSSVCMCAAYYLLFSLVHETMRLRSSHCVSRSCCSFSLPLPAWTSHSSTNELALAEGNKGWEVLDHQLKRVSNEWSDWQMTHYFEFQ